MFQYVSVCLVDARSTNPHASFSNPPASSSNPPASSTDLPAACKPLPSPDHGTTVCNDLGYLLWVIPEYICVLKYFFQHPIFWRRLYPFHLNLLTSVSEVSPTSPPTAYVTMIVMPYISLQIYYWTPLYYELLFWYMYITLRDQIYWNQWNHVLRYFNENWYN